MAAREALRKIKEGGPLMAYGETDAIEEPGQVIEVMADKEEERKLKFSKLKK